MNGFIFLWRSVMDWPWYKDANTFRLFVHLLLRANFKPASWRDIGLNPGELVVSRRSLADALALSEKQVRVALDHLRRAGTVATTRAGKYTIVSIVNWELYQHSPDGEGRDEGQEMAEKRAVSGPDEGQMGARKGPGSNKGNNETEMKKEKERKIGSAVKDAQKAETYPPDFEAFWEQYPRHTAKAAAFKQWRRLEPAKELQEIILHDIAVRLGRGEWQEEQYIPHASTYLNGRRWEDEQTAIPQKDAAGPNVGKGYYNPAFEYAERLRAMEGTDKMTVAGNGYSNPFIQMALEAEERERAQEQESVRP